MGWISLNRESGGFVWNFIASAYSALAKRQVIDLLNKWHTNLACTPMSRFLCVRSKSIHRNTQQRAEPWVGEGLCPRAPLVSVAGGIWRTSA